MAALESKGFGSPIPAGMIVLTFSQTTSSASRVKPKAKRVSIARTVAISTAVIGSRSVSTRVLSCIPQRMESSRRAKTKAKKGRGLKSPAYCGKTKAKKRRGLKTTKYYAGTKAKETSVIKRTSTWIARDVP